MLIAQSPGRDEVLAKVPLVGASGKLQDKLINYVGLSRDIFFLANTLRCFEGDKRFSPSELLTAINKCKKFLTRAIAVIEPQLIVVAGAYALKSILGKEKITDKRGQFYWSQDFNCPVFVILHPAAIIRECSKDYPYKDVSLMTMREKDYMNDWKKIANFIDLTKKSTQTVENLYWELQSGDTAFDIQTLISPLRIDNYKWGTDRELKSFSKTKVVSFDFETEEAKDDAKLLSVSFSIEEGKSRVYRMGKTMPADMKKIFKDESIKKVVTARPFDENFVKKCKTKVKGKIYDVLTMAHVLDENYHAFNLENVARHYADMPNIKSLAQDYRLHLKDAPDDVLVAYNGVDSDAALRSFNTMYRTMVNQEPDLLNYYENFIMPIQDMLSDIQGNGCRINQRTYQTNCGKAFDTLEQYEHGLLDMIPAKVKVNHKNKLKFSRDALIRDIVFTKAGFGCKPNKQYVTEKLKLPQVSQDHLKEFKHVPFVKLYLEWAELEKIYSSYLLPLAKFIKMDNCIYPSIPLTRTVTGRTVMLNPPIQTYPNPNKSKWAWLIRNCLCAPPGWLIGSRDLGQSELRIMAWLSGDKNLLGAIRQGIDLHARTASMFNKIPVDKVTKEQRDRAKPFNFGLIYGLSPKNLQRYLWEEYDIRMSLGDCEEFHRLFFAYPNGYYGLPMYYTKISETIRRDGYVQGVLGRKRRFPMAKDNYGYLGNIERQAINFPVQNFSSDLALVGMMLFWKMIQKFELTEVIKPMWFIHDSVLFMAKRRYMKQAMVMLKQAMEVLAPAYIEKYFKVKVDYPITSDGKAGKTWGSLK